ncbi:MAG: thiamine pyrophosphate-dependent dehydrogenase E1 component subunit alpha [Bacillota bacterium]
MDHRAAGLTDADALATYRWMLLTRRLDERLALLQRSGAFPLALSSRGHEAAQIGAALAFQPMLDWWYPYYRDLGAVLVAGSTPRDLMLSSFGRAADPASAGRQTAYNWGGRRLNIVARSAPVAVQVPQAAGSAMALRRQGSQAVVYCSLGDGATSQGDFHEGLNFASLHRAPVVYVCQNNQWAISVPLSRQTAGGSVAGRAAGYGMPGVSVDGTDPFAVHAAARRAVDRARRGLGPTLLELQVMRLDSHTSDDDQRQYRTSDDLGSSAARDPLPAVRAYLRRLGLLREDQERQWEDEIRSELDEAEREARESPAAVP